MDRPANWLTREEAAEILQVPVPALQHWVLRGWLTPQKIMAKGGGRCYRQFFIRAEVEERSANRPVYETKPRKHRPYDKNPAPEDCIYLAGLFDGEGSIFIREREETIRPVFTLGTGITNSWHPVLAWVLDTFGGSLHRQQLTKNQGQDPLCQQHQQCWLWQASANEAATVIQLIRPHLRIKHRQADLALKFQEHMRLHHRGRWHPATSADIEFRRSIRDQISALNGRQKSQKKYRL